MDKQQAQQLHRDLDQFLKTTTALVGEFHDRINAMSVEAAMAQAVRPEQNGILLDYKTFSEVVNALDCLVNSGDTIYAPLCDKLIALGRGQEPKPEVKPEVKAEQKPELPPFLRELFETLEAEAKTREAAATASEDADIEKQIKDQFPGSDVKVIKNPLELLALLGALGDLRRHTDRRF